MVKITKDELDPLALMFQLIVKWNHFFQVLVFNEMVCLSVTTCYLSVR